LNYLSKGHAAARKPVFLVANRQGSGSDELAITSTHKGFPVIDGVSQFLVGTRCLFNFRDFQQRKPMKLKEVDKKAVDYWKKSFRADSQVSEIQASQCLADFGLPMLRGRLVSSNNDLNLVMPEIVFPAVLKTAQPEIDHKSDVGGVILNITSSEMLITAYEDLSKRLGPLAMIAPMVESEGIEMILGVSRDDQFGPVVLVGFGGIYAEVLSDILFLLPPFDAATVKRALASLTLYPILKGVRGQGSMDIDSYCEAAALLSQISLSLRDTVSEIDINPIKVGVDGCVGLDALIVVNRQV
jgi:acyl-CoA synthetase (NDP forming)